MSTASSSSAPSASASLRPRPSVTQLSPGWSAVLDSLRDIVAGTVGGIAGRLVEYPFDTVKTKMQASTMGSFTKYTGSLHCLLETVRHEGFSGLYRGMAAPLLGTVFETSTLFFINGWLKRELSEAGHLAPGQELPMRMVWVAGAGTGLAVSFVLTPIELIKCRLQVTSPTSPRYTGPLDCLRRSLAAEGYSVLYRGLFGTMLREVPGTAAWFAAYESFVRAMTPAGTRREDLPSLTIITAGALGGVAYWCIMYPADTVKALQQIADTGLPVNGAPRAAPLSFLATGRYVYRTSGVRGLFAGFVPTVLRAAPSNAAIFYVYEEASRALKAAQERALL